MDILNEVEVDMVSSSGQTSVEDPVNRRASHEFIWKNLHLKESILKQKSRLRWVHEGDINSKYFHFMLKCRTRRNSIIFIKVESGVVEEVGLVKKVIKDHFESKFQSNDIHRPMLDLSDINKLSRYESLRLGEDFTEHQIKEVFSTVKGLRVWDRLDLIWNF